MLCLVFIILSVTNNCHTGIRGWERIIFLPQWIRISEVLDWEKESYLTHAAMLGLYIGCIRTQAHGLQVRSLFNQSDIIMKYCISSYSGTSGSLL